MHDRSDDYGVGNGAFIKFLTSFIQKNFNVQWWILNLHKSISCQPNQKLKSNISKSYFKETKFAKIRTDAQKMCDYFFLLISLVAKEFILLSQVNAVRWIRTNGY